jgi:hypothetical protein
MCRYHLRKQNTGDLMNVLTGAQCGYLITQFIALEDDARPCDPQYGSVKILTLEGKLKKLVEEWTGLKFETVRIQYYNRFDHVIGHYDTIHPELDGVSYRLDSYGPSRLYVNEKKAPENRGHPIQITAEDWHEVTTGSHQRYSLVGWHHG